MDSQFRLVLFWVFTCFFVLIGVSSLLVLLGYRAKFVDPAFRKWALRTFIGSVTTAVVSLFSLMLLTERATILVTLLPPEAPPAPGLFEKVTYHYDTVDNGTVTTSRGEAVAVLGEGGWQVELPADVAGSPVRLTFNDRDGASWEVGSFFPNRVTQRMRAGRREPPPDPGAAANQRGTLSIPGVAVVMAAEPDAQTMKQVPPALRFNNFARPMGSHYERPYYQWRVFVDEPARVLDTIRQVDYVLHPTFPEPFQTSRDRSRNFELVASGWGGFRILITVRYASGVEAKTTYFLDLKKGWPSPSTQ